MVSRILTKKDSKRLASFSVTVQLPKVGREISPSQRIPRSQFQCSLKISGGLIKLLFHGQKRGQVHEEIGMRRCERDSFPKLYLGRRKISRPCECKPGFRVRFGSAGAGYGGSLLVRRHYKGQDKQKREWAHSTAPSAGR